MWVKLSNYGSVTLNKLIKGNTNNVKTLHISLRNYQDLFILSKVSLATRGVILIFRNISSFKKIKYTRFYLLRELIRCLKVYYGEVIQDYSPSGFLECSLNCPNVKIGDSSCGP